MKDNYTKEVDVLDLFIDWISHWRSLIVVSLIGLVVVGSYLYLGMNNTSKTSSKQELSVDDMESEILSEKDIIYVNELIDLYKNYLENVEEYEKQKDSLAIRERAETLKYITDSKNILEERKLMLTEEQQAYYYALLEVDTKVEGIVDGFKSGNSETLNMGVSKKKAVLLFILFIIIHFLVFAWKYITDKKVKHADRLSRIMLVNELVRMIDWDELDRKRGLDKFINKLRFSSYRRTSLSYALEINSLTIAEKLKNKKYDSVAILGIGLNNEREEFASRISKLEGDLVVKSIDSINHSVNGAYEISGVKAAIIAVKVGFTKYTDLYEELQSLRDRDVDIIGIAVFE